MPTQHKAYSQSPNLPSKSQYLWKAKFTSQTRWRHPSWDQSYGRYLPTQTLYIYHEIVNIGYKTKKVWVNAQNPVPSLRPPSATDVLMVRAFPHKKVPFRTWGNMDIKNPNDWQPASGSVGTKMLCTVSSLRMGLVLPFPAIKLSGFDRDLTFD